jgi:hypothetical protein
VLANWLPKSSQCGIISFHSAVLSYKAADNTRIFAALIYSGEKTTVNSFCKRYHTPAYPLVFWQNSCRKKQQA